MQSPFAGIWIDHSVAIVVGLDGAKAEPRLLRLESEVEPRHKTTGSGRAGYVAHASVEERRQNQIEQFCGRVIEAIRKVPKLVILGPGQAKKELQKAMATDRSLRTEVVGCQGTDQLSERQLVALVRDWYPD